VCPSCLGRRMNDGALNLTDHVLDTNLPNSALGEFKKFDAMFLGALLQLVFVLVISGFVNPVFSSSARSGGSLGGSLIPFVCVIRFGFAAVAP
jgi:hypothetical protein